MAKYTFTAVHWGRDIEETAYTFAKLRAILERWLVWDEGGGYMRCAPSRVERDNGKSVDSSFLYAISHGCKSYKDLQRALSTKGAEYTNAARLTLANNGGTFFLDGAPILHNHGYYVGGLVPSAIVAALDVTYIADCLERFVQQHVARTEGRKDIYLGTWVNGGNVYIGLSNWIPDRDQAIGLGRERGELAVWDCERGEEGTL